MMTIKYTKRCAMCKETMSAEQFSVSRSQSDGYHSYCKTCHNAKNLLIRKPETPAWDLPWPLANKKLLYETLATKQKHEFKTICGRMIIVDFRRSKLDISIYAADGELEATYRFVNSDQKQALDRIISILHEQDIKVTPL